MLKDRPSENYFKNEFVLSLVVSTGHSDPVEH